MIYIFCFLSSALFAYFASRSKNRQTLILFSALSILSLSILGGLRDVSIGTDTKLYGYPNYMDAASSRDLGDFLGSYSYKERGYLALCYFASKFFGHFNWALFFYQLITVTCVYIGAYRHRKYISMPYFMLIFCFMFYNNTLNVIRQSMACAIIFMGLIHLEEKRYFRFLWYVIAAVMFHDSAILAIPLLICLHLVVTSRVVCDSWRMKLFLLAAMILILLIFRRLAAPFINLVANTAKYSYYLNNGQLNARFDSGTSFSHMIILLGSLVVLTIYRRQADKILIPSHEGGIIFWQFNLIFSIVYYSVVRLFATRILLYYDFIQLLLIACVPCFIREKHLKFIVKMGVMSVVILSWWYIYVRGRAGETWPYKSIL